MRSPLKYFLQKAFADALTEQQKNATTVFDASRRRFIKRSAQISAGVCASLSSINLFADEKDKKNIAIIGGGIAGLNAAYQLQKAGIEATVYEASSRTGGRMFTVKNKLGKNMTTDLGGEFVDTTHADIISLVKEFNLDFYDLRLDDIINDTVFIENKYYTNTDIKNALAPFVLNILKDINSLPENINYTTAEQFKQLDNQNIVQYLKNLGINGWLLKFLDVVLTREYGMEAKEQSAINFLIMFVQPSKNEYDLFGPEHEVLKIKGGSQHLTNVLHHQLKNNVRLNYTLTTIKVHENKYELIFNHKGHHTHIKADYVISAIPFSILRKITLDIPMPEQKHNCIKYLGYGNSSKFIMGFDQKTWRNYSKSGQTYSDYTFGCAWDSSRMQPVEKGSLTVFGGGDMVEEMVKSDSNILSDKYLSELNFIYPQIKTSYNNKNLKFCWPQNPYSNVGYSSFKVGQWSTLAGWEIQPIGNIFFAGEHCSLEFQGYMNGAAETGRMAAEEIVKKIKFS